MPVVPQALLERPIDLRANIGSSHDAIAGTTPQAQRFYDQGLTYLHNYVWIEAARSFNQALRLDPRQALAYVGLSAAYEQLNQRTAAHSGARSRTRNRRHRRTRTPASSDCGTAAGSWRMHRVIRRCSANIARRSMKPVTISADAELWLQRGTADLRIPPTVVKAARRRPSPFTIAPSPPCPIILRRTTI
jgi:hypothetical protein